jgi:hypothetical protein
MFTRYDEDSMKEGHTLYTFGRNFHGQLGLMTDFDDRNVPSATSLGFRPSQHVSYVRCCFISCPVVATFLIFLSGFSN